MTVGGGLVGRDQQLSELNRALAEVQRGEGQLVLVAGEPGIGKTALVEQVAATAAQAGLPTFWGRCWEGGGAAPFWPWAQVLRAALAESAAQGVEELLGEVAPDVASVVPELAAHEPSIRTPLPAGGLDARLRVFESVTNALGAVAARLGSIVVVLEDVHAADESSLQLLRFVARKISDLPALVLVTLREGELASSPARCALVAAAARHGRTISLTGLTEGDVGHLLERTGRRAAAASVAPVVHAATGGNPFLVLESARLLAAGADPARFALPAEAQAIVRRRLDSLNGSLRSTLGLAALLGREFELATLARLTGMPPDDLLDDLSEAEASVLVSETGLGRWAFAHALLREALVEELDPDARPALHRRAAEALSWRYGDDPDVAAQIALHLTAAARDGATGGALEACERAASIAMARFAYEEAAAWWEQALDFLATTRSGDERRRYEILLAISDARLRQGSVNEGKEASARAFKAARACGSVELLAQAAVRIAPYAMSDPVVITALDDALCELPEADGLLRAQAMVAFARVMGASSISRTVLRQVNDEGLAMARRVAQGETLWPILWQWHQNAFRDLDSLEARVSAAAELLALAEQSKDPERVALARLWHAANLFELGDGARATEEARRAQDEAERLRQPFLVWSAVSLHVRLALLRGDFEGAISLARRAHTLGGALDEASSTERGAAGSATDTFAAATSRGPSAHCDFANAEWEFDATLWVVRRYLGQFEDLVDAARAALRRWPVYGLDCTRQLGIAYALAELGRRDEAKRELDGLLADGVAETLFGMVTPYGLVDAPRLCCPAAAAEVCWVIGDNSRAALLYDLLAPYADRHVIVGEGESRGACARYLGQLAALMGRHAVADAHFEAAHQFHNRIGARALGALGRRDHARMLLGRARPGDRARARDLLTHALQEFRSIGMAVYAERAQAELDTLVAAGGRPTVWQEGEYWTFEHGGVQARVRDSKGVQYLARLMSHAGRELHALDLVTDGASELTRTRTGDAGALLDTHAKAAYRRRLQALEAEAGTDGPGTVRAREEMEFLEGELARAVALGGRDRRAASDAERARQSVTRAIRSVIDKLAEAHPGLGEHLRLTIRTGTYSSYDPEA